MHSIIYNYEYYLNSHFWELLFLTTCQVSMRKILVVLTAFHKFVLSRIQLFFFFFFLTKWKHFNRQWLLLGKTASLFENPCLLETDLESFGERKKSIRRAGERVEVPTPLVAGLWASCVGLMSGTMRPGSCCFHEGHLMATGASGNGTACLRSSRNQSSCSHTLRTDLCISFFPPPSCHVLPGGVVDFPTPIDFDLGHVTCFDPWSAGGGTVCQLWALKGLVWLHSSSFHEKGLDPVCCHANSFDICRFS